MNEMIGRRKMLKSMLAAAAGLGAGSSITMNQALHYVLSFPVSTAIVGITRPEQLEEKVEIARNFKLLNAEQRERLEQSVSGSG